MNRIKNYSFFQTFWLVILRMLVGWHFLYEGVSKMLNHGWSAYPYLMDSGGFMAEFFRSIAANPVMLTVVNYINIYGLTLVGLGLILGCFASMASVGGILFLAMYYLSHPPFIGADYLMPTEGSYLWIDKNLIEAAVLFVLICFPTSRIIGFDRYIFRKKIKDK
ncbi:MAG: DoxX family membrane protein [Dysgonamonadaceae bacterium]|jgi:thiosulfate dehydrogenase [quinone] large subunit|nr:DoxX family membrane protein [Dysgonamonadaceae bacterium]